jgi:hypothetical protein
MKVNGAIGHRGRENGFFRMMIYARLFSSCKESIFQAAKSFGSFFWRMKKTKGPPFRAALLFSCTVLVGQPVEE